MLRKATDADILQYRDYAYQLSQSFTTSSFPTYLDGIKTREDFYEVASRKDRCEVLLFEQERVLGWIHYYWEEEERFISFYSFLTEEQVEEAIDEFLAYAGERFAGYQIDFGFPAENVRATAYLQKCGFTLGEESEVFVLHFKDYEPKAEDTCIRDVTSENWDDFKRLHDEHTDMYWNSERLHKALLGQVRRPWHFHIYYREGQPMAAIYYVFVDSFMEIFGVDFAEGRYDAAIFHALFVRALNHSKACGMTDMTYFSEGEENEVLEKLGFRYITKYVLYWNREAVALP